MGVRLGGCSRPAAREILLALAFGVPLFVYLLTLAPGLTWAHNGADGGDLVTAAYTLGVPHPPGYPTFTLLAWAVTRLPWGNVAWRVNLFSALSTAVAAALIYLIVMNVGLAATSTSLQVGQTPRKARTGPDSAVLIAGLAAACSYAFAYLVWSQALIAEVYALTGLWTALLIGLTLLLSSASGESVGTSSRAGPGKLDTCLPLAVGLVSSLGLGVHLTLGFLAPVVAWALLRRSASLLRPLALALLGFVAGLLVWFYLPLRAGQGGVNWGDATTLEGFWWLVSGTLYRSYVFGLPAADLGQRLAAWAEVWVGGVGLTGLALAAIGVIWLTKRGPGWLGVTSLSFAGFNIYALGYDTADSVVYLVPAFVLGCTWLGIGLSRLLHWVYQWRRNDRWLIPLMLTLAFATPLWMLVRNGAALDLGDDRGGEHFCRTVMNQAPPNAILLSTTDRQTFALWYCQQVNDLRPDVAIVDEGLRGFEWYRIGLQRFHPDLWRGRSDVVVPSTFTDERPLCRIRREAQTEWLDCQN